MNPFRLSHRTPVLPRRPHNLHQPGQDQFGSSVSLSDETLVVGGVGHNSSAGAAYVFTVSRSGAYQADQRIEHPDGVRTTAGESSRDHEEVHRQNPHLLR